MTYDQYTRELRIKRLDTRTVDNRVTVRWPERWTTRKESK